MNFLSKILFFFILTLSYSVSAQQTYVYSYIDPCTGVLKNINVPSDGVTVNYFGQMNTFQPNQFTDGTFNQWATNVYNSFGGNNPCGSLLGVSTVLDVAQTTALNTINILGSLSALSDIQSSAFNSNAVTITTKSSSKKSKNNNQNNQNTSSQSGGTQGGTTQSGGTSETTQSSGSQGGTTQSGGSQGGTTQSGGTSGTTQPGGSQGGTTQSGGTSGTTQPGGSQGGTTQPGGTSGTNQPGGTPGTNQPGGTSGTTQPGGTSGTNQPGGTSGTNQPGGTSGTTQPGGTSGTNQPGGTSGTNQPGGTQGGTTQSGGTNNQQQSNGSENSSNETVVNSGTEDTDGKTNILGGTSNSIQNGSGNAGGSNNPKSNAPTIVLSSDFAGFNFVDNESSFGGKATGGYTSLRWDGRRTHGLMVDYTSIVGGPNITGFYGFIGKRRIDLISVSGTASFIGRGSLYATTAVGQMWSFEKVKNLKAIYMLTASFGNVYGEDFIGTAAIAGGMYDIKVSRRIDIKLTALYIYAPYISYYNDIVLNSPHVILPLVGTNIGLTKKFKLNLNFGGTYALNQNVMNYTIMAGTRFVL